MSSDFATTDPDDLIAKKIKKILREKHPGYEKTTGLRLHTAAHRVTLNFYDLHLTLKLCYYELYEEEEKEKS